MAGTDTSRQDIPQDTPLPPAIILVRPQLGENIGMCARAMLNCGVTELRIVNPRDGWPNPDAQSAASGAIDILSSAKIYDTTAAAVADLTTVLATTARERDMVKTVHTVEDAARLIRRTNPPTHAGAQKCGILFGPERTGLENDDVAVADAILNIPLNPGFSSLNLAQAVLLACYGWLSAQNHFTPAAPPPPAESDNDAPARKADIDNLLRHLEDEMTAGNFFRSPSQKPTIRRNLRNFFFRAGMTVQEARTFHGIISCLTGKNKGDR